MSSCSSFLFNGYSVASVRQCPSQSHFQRLISDKKQQFQSQWYQALEKLEEKRRWRKTSAELSEVFSRWLVRWKAKECRDSQEIIYDRASGGQPSVSAAPSCSETKASVTTQLSIAEICEVPAETGGLKSIESGNDTTTIQSIDEEAHGKFTENRTTPELDLKNGHTSSGSSLRTKGTNTPDRPTDTPSTSTTSSSLTPTSRGPYRFLENTPDTPASVLWPSQRARRTPETESPSLKRLVSNDRSSACLKAPKPFEHPPLPDNVFSQQAWNSSRDQGLWARPRRPAASKKLFPSLEKDTGNTTGPQTLFPWIQTEADSRLSSPHEDSIKVETLTLAGEVINTSYSEVVTKHRQGYVPSLDNDMTAEQSPWKKENEIQGTPPKINPMSSFPLQSAPDQTLIGAVIATKTSRFVNALEVYDQVVNNCTRKLFEADAKRCFARTQAGQRCKRWQIRGNEESIRQAIGKLETSDHASEGCQKLVGALVNLSLCEAETWPGHKANLNQILIKFRKVTGSLSSGDQTPVPGVTTTNNTASPYSQTIVTSMHDIHMPSNAFTGFEPWQPQRMARADVSNCLRELVENPLDLEKERKSGYIYAYRAQGIFGFVKIGHTTRDIDTRMAEWRVQCQHDPETVLGSNGQVPHVARVEKLIHAELKEFRHKQTKCVCGTIHIEWFGVSHLDVAVVVEKWSAWMETKPYDTNGSLKWQHRERLKELCRPSILPSKTSRGIVTRHKHVKQLEKTFEFAGRTTTASFDLTSVVKATI